jgi:hypothetical protein
VLLSVVPLRWQLRHPELQLRRRQQHLALAQQQHPSQLPGCQPWQVVPHQQQQAQQPWVLVP